MEISPSNITNYNIFFKWVQVLITVKVEINMCFFIFLLHNLEFYVKVNTINWLIFVSIVMREKL